MIRRDSGKPEITYPCSWSYRIIGTDEDVMRDVIEVLAGDVMHSVETSRTSSSGKYIALVLTVEVRDEDHRLGIYHLLTKDPCIKYVF